MKNKVLAAAGAAAFALTLSATASHAGYFVPGETMGLSLDSPLPEGVFFADLETYGRSDNQPDLNVGVNIPVILWSTPWSFYNTRLEILAAFPFAHIDSSLGVNTTGFVTWALGPIFAHDFGNGLTGGVSAFARSPSPSQNFRALDGRTDTEADFRESLQYVLPGSGPFGGITLMENGGVSTSLGAIGQVGALGVSTLPNDQFAGDFTIEKTFGKFTLGFTGFGNIDIDSKLGNPKQASVELGGLIGYDFGKFSLTGIVTRTVYVNNVGVSATLAGLANAPAYETRGWVRLVVPLYVAPAAPVVTARY